MRNERQQNSPTLAIPHIPPMRPNAAGLFLKGTVKIMHVSI
jgi:hypothetical protein